jgi:hypothetical protein
MSANSRRVVMFGSLFFLVVVPVAMVLFSKFGLDKFKSIRKDMRMLKDSIQLGNFQSISTQNDTFTQKSVKGRVLILHFWDTPESVATKELQRLQSEFTIPEDKPKMLYLSYRLSQDSNQLVLPKLDPANSYFFAQDANLDKFLATAKITREQAAYSLVLVNAQGYLCDVYDTRQPEQINAMMRQLTLVIPKNKRKKYQYRADANLYENID